MTTSDIPRGTKVRATWTAVIEGLYLKKNENGSHDISDDVARRTPFVPAHAAIETFLADEPRVGSVVLDKDGDAWQLRDSVWFCATDDTYSPSPWAALNETSGPIQVVWNA